VAVGNILRGVPINSEGFFTGTFLGLLNPYSILIGVLSLVMFVMHGATFMTLKTEGELQNRMSRWASGGWIAFVVIYFLATIYTFFEASYLLDGVFSNPLLWIFLIVLLGSILYLPMALKAQKYFKAFLSSSLMITGVIGIAAVSMFPRLVPSITDLAYSLTVYNASSTPRTLTAMLIIALIGMPIVIGYSIYIYRIFRGKVVLTAESY